MELSTSEKLKVIMNRLNITMSEVARLTGQTRQNLSNKMQRNNFTESDLRQIAEAIGCTLEITFHLPDETSI